MDGLCGILSQSDVMQHTVDQGWKVLFGRNLSFGYVHAIFLQSSGGYAKLC